MIIELDIEPAEVGILLDALTDYRDRTRMEAEGEQLATVPSRVVISLAHGVEDAARKLLDQLAEYADAIPAVARVYDGQRPLLGAAL